MKLELVGGTVERETEKAFFVNVSVDSPLGMTGKSIWMPKSQVEIVDGKVYASAWIVSKKNEEIAESRGGVWAEIITAQMVEA